MTVNKRKEEYLMDIRKSMVAAGIECNKAACVSVTEYVCYNTTPEEVNAVLKSIGAYGEYEAFWSSDSFWDRDKTVYINRRYTNGKSWD